jgi:hypothetical protein
MAVLTVEALVSIIAAVTQGALLAVVTQAGRRVFRGPMAMRIHIRRGPARAR